MGEKAAKLGTVVPNSRVRLRVKVLICFLCRKLELFCVAISVCCAIVSNIWDRHLEFCQKR